jgi:hypothetical protein
MPSNGEAKIQSAANAWKNAAPGADTDAAKKKYDDAVSEYNNTMRAGGQTPRPAQDIAGFRVS